MCAHISTATHTHVSFSVIAILSCFILLVIRLPHKSMGKNRKNKNSEGPKQEEQKPEEQKQEENNNAEGTNEKNNEQKSGNNKQNAGGAIVLGVHLHCPACVDTVVKSLRGFDGVEEIETNTKDSRVTVKGKSADPVKVAERVRRKTGKHVDIISPVQKKQPEKKQPEKKPEAPKVIEVVLKIYLHCEKCAKDVKKCFHKMNGVQTVNIDMAKSLVTVKGTFDHNNLVKYISKKMKKHAEIMPPPKNTKQNQKEGENQKQEQEKKDKEKSKPADKVIDPAAYLNLPPGFVYLPEVELFSDENPNACSIL